MISVAPKGKAMAANIPADERYGPINYFLEEYDPKYDCFKSNGPKFDRFGQINLTQIQIYFALIYGAVIYLGNSF